MNISDNFGDWNELSFSPAGRPTAKPLTELEARDRCRQRIDTHEWWAIWCTPVDAFHVMATEAAANLAPSLLATRLLPLDLVVVWLPKASVRRDTVEKLVGLSHSPEETERREDQDFYVLHSAVQSLDRVAAWIRLPAVRGQG